MKRAFIFGAGFSKPAGMPLATELFKLLIPKNHDDKEMQEWLEGMAERLDWLSSESGNDVLKLNIEQVFHYAHFDIETFRIRQHLEPVGRYDGPGTSWNTAEKIENWLSWLEEDLCDVIFEQEEKADLSPIKRWAETLGSDDSILTFNYDTLVERTITALGKPYNHGIEEKIDIGISVYKLHGSIDWIVAHRKENISDLTLLFDKENFNRTDEDTGHEEEDLLLCRCPSFKYLHNWLPQRSEQIVEKNTISKDVGIAGLGAYKQLHLIPGLGVVWAKGMKALYEADVAIVVGFSMSDFDALAQMQFVEVARNRIKEKYPLKVIVIDPCINDGTKQRFQNVFRNVEFIKEFHEKYDWNQLKYTIGKDCWFKKL